MMTNILTWMAIMDSRNSPWVTIRQARSFDITVSLLDTGSEFQNRTLRSLRCWYSVMRK